MRLLIALVLVLPALSQNNMDCKCHQVEGQEYVCKCMASTVLPASVDFSATVGTKAVSAPAKTDATTVAKNTADGTPTGKTTATGKEILTGPRGGQYHISASGKKVYERKK